MYLPPVEESGADAVVGGVTLAEVVAVLAPCLKVLAHPSTTRPVRHAVVHDPADPSPGGAGAVVLAVGLDVDRATRLVADAGKQGAAAVVVKVPDPPPALCDAARTAGVALVTADPTVPWGELHRLLTSAIAVADSTADGGGRTAGATAVDDLFAACDLIAAELGGPVIVEDAAFRVLAYSSLDQPDDEPRRQVILGRRVLADWFAQLNASGLRRRLLAGDAVLAIEAGFVPGSRPRRVAAIRAADELLGVLWLGEGTEPFAPHVDADVRRATAQLAPHLVRVRAGRDRGGAGRGALLRQVLDGGTPAGVLAAAMDVPVDSACAVVGFALGRPDPTGSRLTRMRDLLDVQLATLGRPAASAMSPDAVHCLVALRRPASGELPTVVAAAARRLAAALGVPVRAGCGSVVAGLDEARVSAAEADQVLGVLAGRSGTVLVAGIDELREPIALREIERHLRTHPALLRGRVAELLRHDEAHDTRYVETLRTYLDCFGDHAKAADRMHLHVNSFRYRIRRLAEISGVDLDDPVHRLVAQLQLRVLSPTDGS